MVGDSIGGGLETFREIADLNSKLETLALDGSVAQFPVIHFPSRTFEC